MIKAWVIIAVKRFAMSKQLINKTIILVTEIAVVTDKKLELLDSNGMLVGSTINLTAELKTLAFDNARSQFIVSDRVSQNDSIFSVLLTSLQRAPPVNETKVTPLVTNLPDDVQVGKLIKQIFASENGFDFYVYQKGLLAMNSKFKVLSMI